MSSPAERLRRRIGSEGPVSFAIFMREALYGPGGYYSVESSPIGEQGDFVTGSSLSPLFGHATARLLLRLDRALGTTASFLEVGYGTGAHLQNMMNVLRDARPRRLLACDRIARPLATGIEAIERLEDLEPGGVSGMIFSYELFDALPVHRLIGRSSGELGELCVDVAEDGRFVWIEQELSDPGLVELVGERARLEPGQIADVSIEWRPLYRQLAERLARGLLVTCDFGFERPSLLDPRVRFHGTLACYRRQRVHRDALDAVGRQDLAAHVDFTALREEGERAGLETIAWTRQALWLLACGVFEQLQEADQMTRLEAMTLLDAAGMGEEIRVLVQGRGVDAEAVFDQSLIG